MTKYFKPKSLTWWVSFTTLLAGLLVATETLHGLSSIVETINRLTGHVEPVVLINSGLFGIGIRGAIK